MGINDQFYEYYLSAEVIAYLNTNIGFKNQGTWTQWRRFMVQEIMYSYQHPWLRSSLLSKAKTTGSKLERSVLAKKIASSSEIATIIKSVELYLHLFPDGILEKRIREKWNDLINGIEHNIVLTEAEKLSYVKKYDDSLLTTPILTHRSWWPILILLGLITTNIIQFSDSAVMAPSLQTERLTDYPIQLFSISATATALFFLWLRSNWVIKKTQEKLKPYYELSPKIKQKINPYQILCLVLLWLTDSLIVGSLFTNSYSANEIGLGFYVYSFYRLTFYSWVYFRASLKIPNISEIVRIGEESQFLSSSHLSAEENNQEIVLAETKLQANSQRQEGYMLESAVLGALAFGGSLQMVTADSFDFSYTLGLLATVNFQLVNYVCGASNNIQAISQSFTIENGLQTWVSLMSLLCACFFLAVIAIRIRFNSYYETGFNQLSQAKYWNEIEDLKLAQNEPIEKENKLIQLHLRNCNLTLEKLESTIGFMDFFRSLGVFSFFGIVFLAGLYLGSLGVFLLLLIFTAQGLLIYSKHLNNFFSNFKTNVEEFYLNYSNIIEYVLWASYGVSVIWLSFIDPNSGVLLQNYCIIVSAIWLLFSTIFPDMEVEKWEGKQVGYQQNLVLQWLLSKQFRISAAFFLIGLVFKNYYLPGAGFLIILSMLATVVGAIFTPKIKSKAPVLNVLTALTLSLFAIGISTKFMAWQIADSIVVISFISLLVLAIFCKLNLSVFTGFTKRLIIVYGLLGISILVNTGIYLDINPTAINIRNKVMENAIYLDFIHGESQSKLTKEDKNKYLKAIDDNLALMEDYSQHPNLKNQTRLALKANLFIELISSDSLNLNRLNSFKSLNLSQAIAQDAYIHAHQLIETSNESLHYNEHKDSLIVKALEIE